MSVGRTSLVADETDTHIHNQYERVVIQHHRDCVREEMLGRIVCFGSDPWFCAFCKTLSDDLGITISEASSLLWPVSHAIYKAAEKAHE